MPANTPVISMKDDSDPITPADLSPTCLPDAFLESKIAQTLASFHLPRYEEIPDLPLYRDQLIGYIDQVLSPLTICYQGSWLTPSMVNNYVKSNLIPSPVKKQYRREHIAKLLVTCIFKQFLPIAAIDRLFRIQFMTYPIDIAYNYVALEIETALAASFSATSVPSKEMATVVTRESLLVHSAAEAFASKAYLLGYLAYWSGE